MADSSLTTIILRFRDLGGLDRGQTVARHQAIIKSSASHHVWWGWWHKPDETVPAEAFTELAKKANTKGLVAYLMDSGQDLIYRVICTDIHWDAKKVEINSPGISETPEYYNERKYLAWFRLTEITEEPVPEPLLRKFSYLRIDEFFASKKSAYEPFYGKRVHSVRELRQQDRTIWFLRTFRNGDRIHEVSLLDSREVAPLHFATEYFESKKNVLLWVSDTHFSEEEHHAFPHKATANTFPLADRIHDNFVEKIEAVAGLIMSGDITWKALPGEYDLAKKFIETLNYWALLKSDQIAVCPGNHDLKFSTNSALKDTAIGPVKKDFRKAYSTFYQDTFFVGPNEFLSCGRRFLMGKAVPVDIVCLNSSSLQQLKNAFQGHGFIGDKQMEDAAKQMNWEENTAKPKAYRIVVLHHHLLPTTYSSTPASNYPYSVVLDAEALSRWIVKYRVDLVLHGHMHQPFCARISRPIDVRSPEDPKDWHDFYVVGMGSTGVHGELGEINKNTLGFLQFEKDGVEISVHSIHPTNPSEQIWMIKLPYRQ